MMAYFPSSNYDQYHDNYHYYQPYNYDQQESRYVQYYSDHTEYNYNAYELVPTQSLVGYYYNDINQPDFLASKNATFHEKGNYFYDPVSTQFVISYSTAGTEANDLDFEEYDLDPFNGGYDISETYGKALPPSDDICYPPTKIDTNLNMPLSLDDSPDGKQDPNFEGKEKPSTNLIQEQIVIDSEEDDDGIKPKSNLIQEENVINSEEDEDDEEYEDEDEDDEDNDDGNQGIVQNFEGEPKPTNENIVTQVIQEEIASKMEDKDEENRGNFEDDKARNEGGYSKEIRRQIPPGYGIEAMDLCEGLFGGYFPCLSKRNKGANCEQCGVEAKIKMDDYEYFQGTVDYLFGNPNPYGGAMPEKGSYGDPMYNYQRHYPQKSISGQLQNDEHSSWLYSSGYYYAHNGDYQYS